MEWYKEDVVSFIGELRKRDLLWNAKNKHYKDLTMRRVALNELSSMFGCSIHEVKNKISNLRRQFNREHLKVTQGHESVVDQGPRWFAYKPLLFLVSAPDEGEGGPRNEEEQHQVWEGDDEQVMKTEAVESNGEVISIPDCPPLDNGTLDPPVLAPRPASAMKRRPLKRRKERRDSDDGNPRDEHSVYGEHVANQLRALGDRVTAATVRFKIDEVLFKASMGEYPRSNQNPTTSPGDDSPDYNTEAALYLVEPKLEPVD